MKLISFILMAPLFLSSCVSFAPFSNPYSGRSNGEHRFGLDFGTTHLSQYSARGSYGITKDLDFGLLFEMGGLGTMMGAWSKYALINQEESWALAFEGAFGKTLFLGSGTYYDIGPILSYKTGDWEPFVLGRFNYVRMDPSEWDSDSELIGTVKIPSYAYYYYSFAAGCSYWFHENAGVNLNLSVLTGGDLDSTTKPLVGASFLSRF